MDHQTFDEHNEGHFESEGKTVQKALRGAHTTYLHASKCHETGA